MSLGEPVPAELREHVGTCSTCQERLKQLQETVGALRHVARVSASTTVTGPTRAEAEENPVPAAIGKYLVVGRLGKGGQAQVYRALHPELNRELVIKISGEPVQGGETERDLLVREGRVLADLEHPGLARVHDLGFHESRPFLVMEYVRGLTLAQHATGRKLSPRQASHVVAEVARALGVAHRRGVVHQDIKPSNILVDEAGKPRLIDFGLARLRGAWTGEAPQPSGGTASFMAPEQARAEADRVGPQSDVFALGGVLYFLLTGRPPFSGFDWLAALERAGRCEFDRNAVRSPGVPRGLQAICLKAMAA
jgi:serine/threonine protein kinase